MKVTAYHRDELADRAAGICADQSNVIAAPWTPALKPDQLATLAFYDVRCGRVLIDKDNEIAYSPILLRGLEALGTAAGNIVGELGREADSSQRIPDSLLPLTVNADTPVAQAFQKLKPANTSLSTLSALRGLSEEQRRSLAQATADRQRLDAEDPVRVAALEERNGSAHQNRLNQVVALASALSEERLASLALLISDKGATALAAKQIMEASLGTCPLGGVGSDPWRTLYNAARAYSLEHAYLAHQTLIIDRFRATWERVVEEGMFSEAVLRYRKGVETKRIENTGLAASPEVFKRVHWGMSDLSDFTEAHDEAAAVATPLATPGFKGWKHQE